MSLTQKERVIAQIQHRETDYIPYTINLEEDVAKRLDGYYGDDTWRTLVNNAIRSVPIPTIGLLMDEETVATYWTDLYGSKWRVDRRPQKLVEPAIDAPSLEGFTFPNVDSCFDSDWKGRVLQTIEEYRDHFLVAGFGFGIWERTWTLRGFTEVLMDLAANPIFFEELVDQVANHQLAIIERLVDLPVDGIMFNDDWGYQQGVLLGPERWRRILKPHYARMYARVHQAGKYTLSHCCGSIRDIMPDIIEIGLDVLESVQPEARGMNPYELKRCFGGEITFWGALGSQSVVPFGTPGQIKEEVARLCNEMGRGGGYILSSAKPLQPETPTENAAAIVESFLHQAGVAFP